MLSDIPASTDDRVLIDFRTADDAGVYRWESGPALVQTVDFFTPIVDDPYTYGAIAAANAVSDIYAMGGTPLTALAIAAFPKEGFEPGTSARSFRAGSTSCAKPASHARGQRAGSGNQVRYAITARSHPRGVCSERGREAGRRVFLPSLLVTGIVGTANQVRSCRAGAGGTGCAIDAHMNARLRRRCRLCCRAVHACTDIKGFGPRHASEMARAAGSPCRRGRTVPLFDGVLAIAGQNAVGRMGSNQEHFSGGVRVEYGVDADREACCTTRKPQEDCWLRRAPALPMPSRRRCGRRRC